MPLTGRIGGADSKPGNLVLAYGSSRQRSPYQRSTKNPLYRVQIFAFTDPASGDYGIGPMIVELDRFHGLAYADYINSVPEAFYTISNDDPKVKALRGYSGKAHVRIYRGDDLVWVGHHGLEHNSNGSDTIFYAYGYLANLYWQQTIWQRSWSGSSVGTIVSDSWADVQAQSNSRLAFCGTGTIQSPTTTRGGSTAIVLPLYEAYYKRYLYLMQEMAGISGSDTGQTTLFRITTETSPKFELWKDFRRDVANVRWDWRDGRGKLADFLDYEMPVYHRNAVRAAGQQPRDLLLRQTASNGTDMTAWGRMEDSLFFAWVRDSTEMDRVMRLRLSKALLTDRTLLLDFHVGAEQPPHSSGQRWRLGDTIPVKIDRGMTNIDERFQVVGYQVAVMDGNEKVRALIQEPISA